MGYGVADQQQYFVLNDEKRQLVTIEAKLRALANLTGASICGLYDVVRQDMNQLKNLKRGRTTGDDLFGDEYSYWHINTQPGETGAESSFVSGFSGHLDKITKD